jgi:hypothetical protein
MTALEQPVVKIAAGFSGGTGSQQHLFNSGGVSAFLAQSPRNNAEAGSIGHRFALRRNDGNDFQAPGLHDDDLVLDDEVEKAAPSRTDSHDRLRNTHETY